MPRKYSVRNKKRRLRDGNHRKGRRDTDTNNNNQTVAFVSSLEEDLRRQRIRQQEREKEHEEQQRQREIEDSPKEQDSSCQDSIEQQQDESNLEHRNNEMPSQKLLLKGLPCMSISVRLPPSFTFSRVQESSPRLTVHERTRLCQLWHTQYLMDNMFVNPRASALFSKKLKWLNHTLPDGLHCSWDLTCKHRLHPSARTMDVAMLNSDALPSIATVVQGGWGLFRVPGQGQMVDRYHQYDRVQTLRCPPVHAIRIQESSGYCGTVIRSQDPYSPYRFFCYQLPDARSYIDADLVVPVTDFCFGKDVVLFSCPRYNSNNAINPLYMSLGENSGGLRALNVQNFPQSDALRVEMTCNHDKHVAFGHRNGQVSLLDLRASRTICSIFQCEESTSSMTAGVPLGSVSDLCFLSSSDSKQILVRRSFGSSQVHDIRRSSSSQTRSSHRNLSSSTVLHNLVVPIDEINPTLSANCNGFAVDPCGKQTMISPYINDKFDACLGVWSLQTGLMVGSRLLQTRSRDEDVLYVEMCQQPTPSFSCTAKDKVSSSSFAIWLKCGAFTRGRISSKVGSLHQVSFPGYWN